MKPIDVKSGFILSAVKILMKNILSSKLMVMTGHRNTKIFLLRDTRKIGRKKFLSLPKLRIQFRGHS